MTPLELRNRVAEGVADFLGADRVAYDDPLIGLPNSIRVVKLVDAIMDDLFRAGLLKNTGLGTVQAEPSPEHFNIPGAILITGGAKRLIASVRGTPVCISWTNIGRLTLEVARRNLTGKTDAVFSLR